MGNEFLVDKHLVFQHTSSVIFVLFIVTGEGKVLNYSCRHYQVSVIVCSALDCIGVSYSNPVLFFSLCLIQIRTDVRFSLVDVN